MTIEPPTATRYRPRQAPYPLEPLQRIAGDNGDLHELARRLNISHRWARELKATGLTDTQADRYACRLGHHPGHIWPTWWNIEPDIEEGPDGTMQDRAAS